MGFSVAATFTIFGIASLLVFGIIGSVIVDNIRELSRISKMELKEEDEDFEILNITATYNGNGTYKLEVVIKNTGSTTIDAEKFTFLVDGEMKQMTCNVSKIYPLNPALFTNGILIGYNQTSHRLKAVSERGVEKYAEYAVG
ncbi:hypothetical protein DRO97_03780 [Archaeoglobales archaeon]|nr:MAG: hypothetical protein DRO97_03780 [Archaeoglobales archaeon]